MSSSTPEKLSPCQEIIAKDFYISFMHSQGNQTLQVNIFSFMLDSYRRRSLSLTSDEFDTYEDWLQIKSVPGRHGAGMSLMIDDATVAYESSRVAEELVEILRSDLAFADESCISQSYGFVVEQDLTYQKSERFIGNDPHASYFRRHVILQNPTGRQSFDDFYAALGAHEPDIEQGTDLARLEHAWERNHPDQSFFE